MAMVLNLANLNSQPHDSKFLYVTELRSWVKTDKQTNLKHNLIQQPELFVWTRKNDTYLESQKDT